MMELSTRRDEDEVISLELTGGTAGDRIIHGAPKPTKEAPRAPPRATARKPNAATVFTFGPLPANNAYYCILCMYCTTAC